MKPVRVGRVLADYAWSQFSLACTRGDARAARFWHRVWTDSKPGTPRRPS